MRHQWVTVAIGAIGVLGAGTATALVNTHVLDVSDAAATETNQVLLPASTATSVARPTAITSDPAVTTATAVDRPASSARSALTTAYTAPTLAEDATAGLEATPIELADAPATAIPIPDAWVTPAPGSQTPPSAALATVTPSTPPTMPAATPSGPSPSDPSAAVPTTPAAGTTGADWGDWPGSEGSSHDDESSGHDGPRSDDGWHGPGWDDDD